MHTELGLWHCAPELLVPALTEPLLLTLLAPLHKHGTTGELKPQRPCVCVADQLVTNDLALLLLQAIVRSPAQCAGIQHGIVHAGHTILIKELLYLLIISLLDFCKLPLKSPYLLL